MPDVPRERSDVIAAVRRVADNLGDEDNDPEFLVTDAAVNRVETAKRHSDQGRIFDKRMMMINFCQLFRVTIEAELARLPEISRSARASEGEKGREERDAKGLSSGASGET